jgi:hypothetical protein
MQKLLLFLVLFSFSQSSFAQSLCGYDEQRILELRNDPALAAFEQELANKWAEHASASKKIVITGNDTAYEVPVVFHVIHQGEPYGVNMNLPDNDILNVMDYVNQTFAASYVGYPGPGNGGVHVPIKFVLAKTAVGCNSATGITRYNGTLIPGYTSVGYEYATTGPYLKELAWPTESFLNIFIVNYIHAGQTAGISTSSGIFVTRGRFHVNDEVTVHELGHYFGLPHVFEGDNNGASCPPNNNCLIDGDGVCDTEPCKRFPPPGQYFNPCTGTMSNYIEKNFLNYSDYTTNRFTQGQKEKMLFKLQNMPLVHSLKGEAPLSDVKAAACSTYAQNVDIYKAGGPTYVGFVDIKHHSPYLYNESKLAWVDNSCQYRTKVKTGHSYSIEVNTFFTESSLAVYIDYNNDAVFQPGELACSNSSGKQFFENITIPLTAVLGKPLRMRVIVDTATVSALAPCGKLQNGQAEDYAVIVEDGTGVGNLAYGDKVNIYPNPANDLIHIEHADEIVYVQLLSTDGRMVKEQVLTGGQTSIDISNIASGIYFLRLNGQEGQKTVRFIKQ